MKTNKLFCAIFCMAALLAGMSSCKKDADATLTLSRTSATIEEGNSLTISATSGDIDVTSTATWASSDASVATVAVSGNTAAIAALKAGSATITCTYNGASKICAVTVIAGAASDTRLLGSDYYIISMDETTYTSLNNKGVVTLDMRANGAYDEAGKVTPEDAERVMQIWNNADEIADQTISGPNSFGQVEEWFVTGSVSPKPENGWGNICGGLACLDDSKGCISAYKKLTTDHVFSITVKGNYSTTKPLIIRLNSPSLEEIEVLKIDRVTGANRDGDWETFTVTYQELVQKGIDYSLDITIPENKTFFEYMFVGEGSGARVDIDCVMFYVPAK